MLIWLISDTHFGHHNIIQYANRPFSNAEEMDAYMVQVWNERVSAADHVYHLGDVTMARSKQQEKGFISLIQSLNGHKRLILGNHDHFPIQTYIAAGFEKIRGTGMWFGDGLLLSHFPVHPDNLGFRTKACVHGHIHQNNSPAPVVNQKGLFVPYINVCVEKTAYGPITLEEVRALVKKEDEKC